MLVIGNGESRKLINLNGLNGPKIGCNAIHRDLFVDYLVAIDRRCVEEALQSTNFTALYSTLALNSKINILPTTVPLLNPNSGPYAIILGAELSSQVHLIGFDLWSKDGLINNVYKDTQNYNKSTYCAVDPNYWIEDIGNIFKYYCNTQFFVYNIANWQLPVNWQQPNVKLQDIKYIYDMDNR
jgi:hypothetical protein